MFNVSGEGMTTKNMQGMVTKMGAKEQPHKNKLENNQSIKFNCFTLLQTGSPRKSNRLHLSTQGSHSGTQ